MNDNIKPGAGCSNTPSGKSLKNIFTSIDYFSFRFEQSYEDNRESFQHLLELLTYNSGEYFFSHEKGKNGYTDCLYIRPGINLYYGGEMTRDKYGHLTSYLEMKGEGCREYECVADYKYRDKDLNIDDYWLELFKECLHIRGKCTRIDLPVDDCEGLIDIDTIKQKIANKEYTTRLKKIEETLSYDDDSDNLRNNGLPDIISTIESKHRGYSVTLGNRSHIQLCIYNKKAEQQNKGRRIEFPSWVRYETRFYHDNAEDMFNKLYYELEDHNSSRFIIGCLASIFQLKANNKHEKVNRSRNPIDPAYALLTSKKVDVSMFKSPVDSNQLDDNTFWFIRSASKTLLKIIAALNRMGINSAEVLTALVHKTINKVDEGDLKTINQYLRKHKIQEFKNVDELKQFIRYNNTFVDEMHDPTLGLIIKKKSPKELKEEDGDVDG